MRLQNKQKAVYHNNGLFMGLYKPFLGLIMLRRSADITAS